MKLQLPSHRYATQQTATQCGMVLDQPKGRPATVSNETSMAGARTSLSDGRKPLRLNGAYVCTDRGGPAGTAVECSRVSSAVLKGKRLIECIEGSTHGAV
jgi:hypothetical protein